MKRYIIFSANYLPHLGGVERYTFNLATNLVSSGYEVAIVTSDVSCPISYEQSDGIEIYRLPSFRVLGERFPVIKINRKTLEILRKVFKYPYDFGIINTRFYPICVLASFLLRRKKIPFILIEHGTNHFTVNNKFLDVLGHAYEHLATRMLKLNTVHFAGVSLACTKWLKHFGIDTNTVFYNAIDHNAIQVVRQTNKIELRHRLAIPESAKLICYTGRLVKEKGVQKLIDAIGILRRNRLDVYLVIAGDGDLLDSIRSLGDKYIIALGKIDFSSIINLLDASDVFCLPTDYPEGLPTSILEAAACKCYVVTTSAGGSSEVILDSSYGCILADNTPNEIAKAIYAALSDDDTRKAVTEKTYNKVINEFEWGVVTKNIINFSQKVEN